MSDFPQTNAPSAGGGSVLRRILIGLLLILVGVIALAEVGVITLQTTDTKWSADSKYETSRNTLNRRGVRLGGFSFAPTVTVSGPSGSGKTIADHAAEAIRKVPSGDSPSQAKMEITINQVNPEGSPWMPVFKSGSCTFTATYVVEAAAAGSSIRVQGQISGKVEQSMKGLCSTSLFRQTMGKAVADAIVSDLQKMITKNS